MTYRPLAILTICLVGFILYSECQISAMFGNPIQASNCETWSEWGPCVWLKGKEKRWQRSYFEQLLPGRKGCRNHVFFRLLKDRWGVAFNNFYNYLRDTTTSEEQCGECSYQQSCGRKCHRRGDIGIINPLFVAERKCMGVDQSKACVSTYMQDCKLWPNKNIQLPNVTESMQQIIDNLDYLQCVPEHRYVKTYFSVISFPFRPSGSVCRCCCHPYTPNPQTFECELKPYLSGK
ncbi:hypothetical protein CRE_25722 [Caenorhabditis remanei]|uniref:Uncharacterized protein n=1 Tax=Caenorhabditis remanei TaxID=31234 RepID=E3MLA9_CAERE|nr:hypothetical protein CRE_25722 [Caenorhabditis remanei]